MRRKQHSMSAKCRTRCRLAAIKRRLIYNSRVVELTITWSNRKELNRLHEYTSLKTLECSNICLNKLPELPHSLEVLCCSNNELTELPVLPLGLQKLWCNHNCLTVLPDLPDSVNDLKTKRNWFTNLIYNGNIIYYSPGYGFIRDAASTYVPIIDSIRTHQRALYHEPVLK